MAVPPPDDFPIPRGSPVAYAFDGIPHTQIVSIRDPNGYPLAFPFPATLKVSHLRRFLSEHLLYAYDDLSLQAQGRTFIDSDPISDAIEVTTTRPFPLLVAFKLLIAGNCIFPLT
jgi:hypothetical protein